MPQASEELRAEWPGGDQQAIEHLEAKGFIPTRDFCWIKPYKSYETTPRDDSAIIYLIDEWDYAGLVSKGIGLDGVEIETPDALTYQQPNLSAAEQYILGWMAEEASEVVKMAVGKTLRFGFRVPGRMGSDGEPDFSFTPENELHSEIADFLASVELAYRYGVLDRKRIALLRNAKISKVLNEKDNLGRPLAPQLPSLPIRDYTGDIKEPVLTERQHRYDVFILDAGELWAVDMSYAVPQKSEDSVKKTWRKRISEWLSFKRQPRKSDDTLDLG